MNPVHRLEEIVILGEDMAKMTLNKAIEILMRAAERDVMGTGMGYRSTSDKWRETVSEAWTVCFFHVYRREPQYSDYFNSGIGVPYK